jgi:hypothetical protein
MYKAIITNQTGSATGYGSNDYEAVVNATKTFPGVDTTKCRLSVWYQYSNGDDLQYVSNLFKYLEEAK